MHGTDAALLDENRLKNRLLVVSAPAENGSVKEQGRIYRPAASGMSERQILFVEALRDNLRSRSCAPRYRRRKALSGHSHRKGRPYRAIVKQAVLGRVSVRQGRCDAHAPE